MSPGFGDCEKQHQQHPKRNKNNKKQHFRKKKVGFSKLGRNFDDAYRQEGVGCIHQDYKTLGAPIRSIDPQYRFGDRGSSAEKIDFEKFFTMIFVLKNWIFLTFSQMQPCYVGGTIQGFWILFGVQRANFRPKIIFPATLKKIIEF